MASTHIASIAYDGATKELDVTFHGGARYRYFGVDPDVAAGLANAESQGQFLKRHVIDVCQYKKLDDRHQRL